MKEVNLGRSMKDMGYPMPMNKPKEEEEDETHYPCLYIDQAPDELLGMADEGTATIKYSIKEMTKGERGNRMEIDVLSFKPNQGPKTVSDEDDDGGEAFDKFMSEKEEEE